MSYGLMWHESIAVTLNPDDGYVIGGVKVSMEETVKALAANPGYMDSLPREEQIQMVAEVAAWVRGKLRKLPDDAFGVINNAHDPKAWGKVLPMDIVKVMYHGDVLLTKLGFTRNAFVGMIPVENIYRAFTRHGSRVYQFAEGRAERLIHAEFRGALTSEDIQMPYPSLALQIPLQVGLLPLTLEGVRPQPIREIYLSEDGTGATRGLRICCVHQHPTDLHESKMSMGKMALPAGQRLEDIMVDAAALGDRSDDIYKWVFNALLYITSSAVRLSPRNTNHEFTKLKTRVDEMRIRGVQPNNRAFVRLKDDLKTINPLYRIIVDEGCPRLTDTEQQVTKDGTPLSVRIRVAGHWKKQVHGIGHSLRKLIFIEPYWKGPLDGPTVQPVHLVT